MAFWDDAKKKVLQAVKPRQQEEQPLRSNRADGGFSGYQPKMNKRPDNVQGTGYQPVMGGIEQMMPGGVDPALMQQFRPVGGQTGPMPGMQPQPGMPQQPAQGQTMAQQGRTGYQPPVQPRPSAGFQGNPQGQPQRPGFGQQPPQQPAFQQPAPQQPAPQQPQAPFQRGFTAAMGAAPQQNAPQQPQGGNTVYFPGDYVADGNAYKVVLRVAQITGVPSCFRVIEFMYNNEAVIVNAEQVTDLVEADRCMDLIFGAACAMQQRLMRVSGKQIYLITPPQVYVAPFENLRRAGMEDIDRRWPGALQLNMQPVTRPAQANHVSAFQQQPRQDDFAGGFGRRANRAPMNSDYTDFGGFGMKTR